MSRRLRLSVFLVALAALAVFLLLALHGLSGFGHYRGRYGHLLNRVGVRQRHASNVVASIVFDYRGLDTLGEEFILFSCVMGVVFILRTKVTVHEERVVDPIKLDSQRVIGSIMVLAGVVVALWLIAYGYVTPGGGFQGGVALASAVLLVWVATSYQHYRRIAREEVLDAVEGFAAAAFVAVGLVGLGLTAAYLGNFLPLGTAGTLASSGTIGLLNLIAGIEVAAAVLLLYHEFLREYGQTFPGVEPAEA